MTNLGCTGQRATSVPTFCIKINANSFLLDIFNSLSLNYDIF